MNCVPSMTASPVYERQVEGLQRQASGGVSARAADEAGEAAGGDLPGVHSADLCCPRCHSDLRAGPQRMFCLNERCDYAREGFLVISGQPILIDWPTSIFEENQFVARSGSSVIARDDTKRGWRSRIRRLFFGRNNVAVRNAETFVSLVRDLAQQRGARARVLVIGGGAIGDGSERLYEERDIDLVGTDVYLSPFTNLVADGHHLPFKDGIFDGVWIQAVLEHVLDPWQVAAEIERVLRMGGIVYADTPFIQQVHEGAYDFTRFTLSGHRWIFNRFAEVQAGAVGGAGTALIWSIRYFVRAITRSSHLALAIGCAFFWLRFFDQPASRAHADAASGVFFLGRKVAASGLTPKDMVDFYRRQDVGTTA